MALHARLAGTVLQSHIRRFVHRLAQQTAGTESAPRQIASVIPPQVQLDSALVACQASKKIAITLAYGLLLTTRQALDHAQQMAIAETMATANRSAAYAKEDGPVTAAASTHALASRAYTEVHA
eukprot:COSAG02_NODE_30493_length_550_cov_0.685144_1_plen_123_part_01